MTPNIHTQAIVNRNISFKSLGVWANISACVHTHTHTLGSKLSRNSQGAGFSDTLQRNTTTQVHLQTRKLSWGPKEGKTFSQGSSSKEPTAITVVTFSGCKKAGRRASENIRNHLPDIVYHRVSRHDRGSSLQWLKTLRLGNQIPVQQPHWQ